MDQEDFDWYWDYIYSHKAQFLKWHTKIVRLNNAIAGQDKLSVMWTLRMKQFHYRFHDSYIEFDNMREFLDEGDEAEDYGTEESLAKYKECIAKIPRFRKRYRRARNAFNAYLDAKR